MFKRGPRRTLFALTLLAANPTLAAEPFALDLLNPNGITSAQSAKFSSAPFVLLLGGSEGGLFPADSALAQTLLAKGYNVGTLALFRYKGLAGDLVRFPLDTLAEHIDLLRERFGTCIAFVGISRGSEAALLLASLSPDTLDAQAAVVPSHAVGSAFDLSPFNRPGWTWKGKDVPYVPLHRLSSNGIGYAMTRGAWRWFFNYRIQSEALLAPDVMTSAARIRVEDITKPTLLVSATRDEVWPSGPMASIIEQTMTEASLGDLVTHVPLDGSHFVRSHPWFATTVADWLARALPVTARPADGC